MTAKSGSARFPACVRCGSCARPSCRTTIEYRRASIVMPGLVPGIHVLPRSQTWMAGTGPAITRRTCQISENAPAALSPLGLAPGGEIYLRLLVRRRIEAENRTALMHLFGDKILEHG